MSRTHQSKLYRLWSVPLLLGGVLLLLDGFNNGALHHLLFGAGMLLMGAFAFRHNLFDISSKALDPTQFGRTSVALLVVGVLLALAAAAVVLAA